jgi:hypothetical protein
MPDSKKSTEEDKPSPTDPPPPKHGVDPPDTEPAQEWGERIDTGRRIQRGGKADGPTPGADEKK